MTNLADDAKPLGPGPRCAVGAFLGSLDPVNRHAVTGVLNFPGLTHAGIQRAIEKRVGLDAPSLWSISNHRRGKCRCNRKA